MANYTFSSVTGPNGDGSVAVGGINDAGEVVGSYETSTAQGSTTNAFSEVHNVYTKIDVPFSQLGYATASGVSNTGEIVGNYVVGVSNNMPRYEGVIDNNGVVTSVGREQMTKARY